MKTRLSTISVELDDAISGHSDELNIDITAKLIEWAFGIIGYVDKLPDNATDVKVILESLENRYFELSNLAEDGKASQEEVLEAFTQARVVNALLFHYQGDTAEAIYEIVIATNDLNGTIEIVNKIKA